MSSSFDAWFKGMENEAFPRSFGKNSFVVQYDCKWVSYSPARSRFCGQGRRGTGTRFEQARLHTGEASSKYSQTVVNTFNIFWIPFPFIDWLERMIRFKTYQHLSAIWFDDVSILHDY